MKSLKLLIGITLLAVGIFMVIWAYNHSPEASLGERIMDVLEGEKALSKTTYYTMITAGIVLVIVGLIRSVKSL